MNTKNPSQAFFKAGKAIIIILVSLFLFISSANAAPSLSLTKTYTVDGVADGPAHEGSKIVYTYTVTNSGNSTPDDTAYGVSITDTANYPYGSSTPSVISVGDMVPDPATHTVSVTKTSEYTATEDDLCNLPGTPEGGFFNAAIASGLDNLGAPIESNIAEQTVMIRLATSLIVSKKSLPLSNAHVGEVVHYTFTVQNPAYDPENRSAVISVHHLDVNDNRFGSIDMSSTDLKPGETSVGYYNYTVPSGFNTLTNNAIITADNCLGTYKTVAQHSMKIIHPLLEVTQSVDGNASGKKDDILTFNADYHNKGDCALTSCVLVDYLPKGLTYESTGSSPEPVVEAQPDARTKLTYDLAQVDADGHKYIILKARVDGTANGTLTCEATGTAKDPANWDVGPVSSSASIQV